MKVIHIESGLGNQMLSYCEYLAMKKANPSDDIYIENIIFDIPECNEVTCQWNGYELDKVFGIAAPNIRSVISDSDWQSMMSEIRESQFWAKNMNYPKYFTQAFANVGILLVNTWGDFEDKLFYGGRKDCWIQKKIRQTLPYMYLRMWKQRQPLDMGNYGFKKILYPSTNENLFAGQKLLFKLKGSGIEKIENDIKRTFVFPDGMNKKNMDFMKFLESRNTVAIHARRGDMLGSNYACYATGYFKRAVSYVRQHTENPVFCIFCDPGSISWAKENAGILGLNFKKDEIHFVDWNKSTESYRDMQLMASCKHQIITNSSFGWWGAWLNTNPDKITISPDYKINTTHTL